MEALRAPRTVCILQTRLGCLKSSGCHTFGKKYLGGLVKTQVAPLHPQSMVFSRTGVGPAVCICNELPGDAEADSGTLL